ncbi:hypothetical protein ACWGI8_07435 [Streptomyces sp. NPDC054841]
MSRPSLTARSLSAQEGGGRHREQRGKDGPHRQGRRRLAVGLDLLGSPCVATASSCPTDTMNPPGRAGVLPQLAQDRGELASVGIAGEVVRGLLERRGGDADRGADAFRAGLESSRLPV